jgi:hypothetical protein
MFREFLCHHHRGPSTHATCTRSFSCRHTVYFYSTSCMTSTAPRYAESLLFAIKDGSRTFIKQCDPSYLFSSVHVLCYTFHASRPLHFSWRHVAGTIFSRQLRLITLLQTSQIKLF